MTAHKIVVDVPADHKLHLDIDIPSEIKTGKVTLVYQIEENEDDVADKLASLVPPELAGKGKILGDIVSPNFDEWGEGQ